MIRGVLALIVLALARLVYVAVVAPLMRLGSIIAGREYKIIP
jgi:hypothetical protein